MRSLAALLAVLKYAFDKEWHCRNYAIRCAAAEHRAVQLGICSSLYSIVASPDWPACLRDVAAGCLVALSEKWENQTPVAEAGYDLSSVAGLCFHLANTCSPADP